MQKFDDPLLRQKAAYLGANGWVIPFQLAPGNVRQLLDDVLMDAPEDIDEMFIAFYKDWILLPRVFASLGTNPHFAKYSALMTSASTAFNSGNYPVVTAGTVSVIEGLLSDLTNDKTQKMAGKLQAIETAANIDQDILTAPVVISLNAFLKPLYAFADFTSNQPADLNRHWINHGRAEVKDSQADALKMINAVNALGYAVKFLVP